jgi:hypothetical protein
MISYNEMKGCPKYYRCSAPICPLDPDFKKRVYVNGEPGCTLPKNKRMVLGKNLVNKGLTSKELGGMKSRRGASI